MIIDKITTPTIVVDWRIDIFIFQSLVLIPHSHRYFYHLHSIQPVRDHVITQGANNAQADVFSTLESLCDCLVMLSLSSQAEFH